MLAAALTGIIFSTNRIRPHSVVRLRKLKVGEKFCNSLLVITNKRLADNSLSLSSTQVSSGN